jgi:hypothetical protein
MGTWAEGILDNDAAFDGLGDLQHHLVDECIRLGEEMPSVEATGALGAAIGTVLQLAPNAFGPDADIDELTTALRAHQPFADVSPKAAALLERLLTDEAQALSARRATLAPEVLDLLHSEKGPAPFGLREPVLFEGEAAADFVQDIADWCIDQLAFDFEDDELISDLAREGASVGMLGALLVLEPVTLPREDLVAWREAAKEGLAVIEESADEVPFHQQYYHRLDGVFAALLPHAS